MEADQARPSALSTLPLPASPLPHLPLLSLRGITRRFPAGEDWITVLHGIDLDIHAGEMVAIIGQSGSGKSTLMNIIGCLDQPSDGQYQVSGQITSTLEPDELARLRREYFGFIFQRYHLLGDLDALGNAEVPAIYAGIPASERQQRAAALLGRLGLSHKLYNRPSQLSGGQQQRVSIARALINGGQIILADEPTGALDRHSGIEVMQILRELHQAGHTVILVTHDPAIAATADRIIEISDGHIIRDQRHQPMLTATRLPEQPARVSSHWRAWLDRFQEAFRMALLSMNAHRMRTFLTMLGIIIGIASVVSVVALGQGSREKILKNISSLGTNTITINPGRSVGDTRGGRVRTLKPADGDAIAEQPFVDSVSPVVRASVVGRYRSVEANVSLIGVSPAYFQTVGLSLGDGQLFDRRAIRQQSQDVVIDAATSDTLFTNGEEPLGQVIMLGAMPSRIIGVLSRSNDSLPGRGDTLNAYLPYSTVLSKVRGQDYLPEIVVRVRDDAPSDVAEQAISDLLTERHGTTDFTTRNSDAIRQSIEDTTSTMTLLISAIAVISLIVGGIGVMNIMLVSVTERTGEIGVRMAVGARQGDILQQFLIEAVLVCLLGGLLGIALALGIGWLINRVAGDSFGVSFSVLSMAVAFACSTLIGILFGFLPARNAARLDPVAALSRD